MPKQEVQSGPKKTRRKPVSHTPRCLKLLRDQWKMPHVQVVERWNSFARKRLDLFNFIDIVAVGEGKILGVQVTSDTNHSARQRKIEGLEAAKEWIACGGVVMVISFGKNGRFWMPRVSKYNGRTWE